MHQQVHPEAADTCKTIWLQSGLTGLPALLALNQKPTPLDCSHLTAGQLICTSSSAQRSECGPNSLLSRLGDTCTSIKKRAFALPLPPSLFAALLLL